MATAVPPATPEPVSPPVTAGVWNHPLRWWPAAVLVVAMVILKYAAYTVDSPSMPLLMSSFFGPVIVTGLIMVWWLGFSRASLREKLITLAGCLAIAAVAIATIHFSMQGMGVMVSVIPAGGAAFAVALIISNRWRTANRLPFVLAICAIAMGYWNTLQSEGVTGTFQSQYRWRWEETAEAKYLSSRKQSGAATATNEAPPVGSATEAVVAEIAEWPSFRGPDRDGRLPGIAIQENWDQQPPREVWRKRVGPGWSSFTVAGPHIFTQEQRGDNEAVVCLEANTGAEVWSYEYSGRFWEAVAGAGPRATPTLAGGAVYAMGAQGMLVRLDQRTGRLVWQQDVKKNAEREAPTWGFSSSPLVTNGVVIVHAGGAADKGVFAYDEMTGEKKWSAPAGDHSYSSPQLGTFDGVTGVLMATNTGLEFLSPERGEVLWDYQWPLESYRALQPLVLGQSVLLGTSMGIGTRRVNVQHKAAAWDLTEAWTSREMKADFNDYVQHHDALYGFDGAVFACIDLQTGELRWKKGRYGKGQVLLLPDADQLLVLSEKGKVVLLRATPEKWEELMKFQGIQGKTWNHPVVAGQHLYIRNAEEAACFELTLQEKSATAPAQVDGATTEAAK